MNQKIKKNFAIKPIVTGVDFDNIIVSDNFRLLFAQLGREPTISEIQEISCYLLKEPLSPDIASWSVGLNIDFNKIIKFCKQWIARTESINGRLFIETAGGVCSPCADFHTMADISKSLCMVENILVTTPYLGAISHTISALHILKFEKLIINRGNDAFIQSIQNHLPYSMEIYTI